MDRKITLSLIGMDINASSMTEIFLHAGWSLHPSLPVNTVIINHEEVAEIVNLMDSFIVTEPNFLSSKRKKNILSSKEHLSALFEHPNL